MGIVELFEMGFFSAFWNWSNPILTALVYAFAIVGAVVQILLQKKRRKPQMKWLLTGICGAGMVTCECLRQVITGWDRLAIDIVYGLAICLLMGAIITTVISTIKTGASRFQSDKGA